ncbi:hypothetical protein PsorP6_011226 [Peronosclerospora sorghi]|uniref:Uncharacterized protein n=1 Tax=Peronosclerospora sorghi TaxID=230839 RepID=A0ACC0VVU8_9STRA|nr:hypothetical protein PsorP6_011226 [Peronosclerospora sorghi]
MQVFKVIILACSFVLVDAESGSNLRSSPNLSQSIDSVAAVGGRELRTRTKTETIPDEERMFPVKPIKKAVNKLKEKVDDLKDKIDIPGPSSFKKKLEEAGKKAAKEFAESARNGATKTQLPDDIARKWMKNEGCPTIKPAFVSSKFGFYI